MALTTTTLALACSLNDTTIRVTSASGFVPNQLIYLDDEILIQSGPARSSTPPAIPVRRAVEGTAAVAHGLGASVATGTGADFAAPPPGQIVAPAPSPPGLVRQATVTLSDTQIRALHTTLVTIVPAPGANRVLSPSLVWFVAHFPTPYTQGTANWQSLGLFYSNNIGNDVATLFNTDSTSGNVLALDKFLSNNGGTDAPDHMVRVQTPPVDYSSDFGSTYALGPQRAVVDFANLPLQMKASAAITGGSAANTLTVAVLYGVFDTARKAFV